MNPFGSPFGTRSRADDFARLLDGGTPAMAVPSVVLAGRLRAVGEALAPAVAPRAEFKAALRTRLLAVAAVSAAAPVALPVRTAPFLGAVSWATARRGGRTAGVAAGALASVVAVSGVAVASSQSLPGDPFYGVKRTTEALQLRTADGDVERGTRHLDFAATRLREVRALTLGRDALSSAALPAGVDGAVPSSSSVAAGSALGPAVAERVRRTLADMDTETREGTALLTDAYRDSRTAEPLKAIARFATRQSQGLTQLLPALPAASQDRARMSLALLTVVGQDADEMLGLGVCGPACDPSTSAPAPGTAAPGTAGDPAGTPPCSCEPLPTPAPGTSTEPVGPASEQPSGASDPATPAPAQAPSSAPGGSPEPAPDPSRGPLPVPVPSLPVPVPTLPAPGPLTSLVPTLGPLAPLVDPLLPGLVPGS